MIYNTINTLTTVRERRLINMQAVKNVVTVTEEDKQHLMKPLESQSSKDIADFLDPSSAFESDEHEEYLF